MGLDRPYQLTVRQFSDGTYTESGNYRYVHHPKWGTRPSNYTRAFMLLQKDLLELFNYVEPSDTNLPAYSMRIQELLVRTCIEIEANFKAILTANIFTSRRNTTIKDYFLLEQSHFLSQYSVRLPYWTGELESATRNPFNAWASPADPSQPWTLTWHSAYNTTKHDRANALHHASLQNLVDAFSGLVIILGAQYLAEDFAPGPTLLSLESSRSDDFEPAIGNYFLIRYPSNMPPSARYDFEWEQWQANDEPFARFNFDAIKS